MRHSSYSFEPKNHEDELLPVIRAIQSEPNLDSHKLHRIVRGHPGKGGKSFSKSEIIRGYRYFKPRYHFDDEASFVAKVRMKPVRTQSGVAPVTVLTKPYPCPGKCIFCPNDVRMPKSYLSREPGAQRAAQHQFDPYAQTLSRLYAFYNTGHEVDKVELIVLGGTWSFYPEPYQIWFIKRCFDAMNAFSAEKAALDGCPDIKSGPIDFKALEEEVEGRSMERTYNQVVSGFLGRHLEGRLTDGREEETWSELEKVQKINEITRARCVGLVVETRPDHISEQEVARIRRLGATKVQIGFQSLSDEVLRLNHRGHDVAATRRAVRLVREAGFKIHVHWMPNLHGSDPESDVEDFRRLFADQDFRPDELKIYPCSLIETAELMQYYENGRWRPYSNEELLDVVTRCLLEVPPYCRVTRVIRDIPGDDILVGNKVTNFRQVAERELAERGLASQDIRAREIGRDPVEPADLRLDRVEYTTSIGREFFLQFVTSNDRLVGFCRLSLPERSMFMTEIADCAMIREVHVYGVVVGIGQTGGEGEEGERHRAGPKRSDRSQHLGLGRQLVREAARIARRAGFKSLAVISSVGTREYYRSLGFHDGKLYQHQPLAGLCEGDGCA